ncbi:Mu transposase domain-containing protein [Nonomuraea fuscirosea]|uniref:Mu transposase domain-containing protein n=1 Tax=Nonomuraea fuscirosea TaxID=1291556 RepID=UPI0033DFACCE
MTARRTRAGSCFAPTIGFEAFYCEPGLEGAHEKGGVEGQVGYFRRNYLVPVPEVESLAELNDHLAQAEQREDERRIGYRLRTIGQMFAAEQPLLRPLPSESFETGLVLTPLVDRYSRLPVRTCWYSVPTRYIGRRLRVVLGATHLVIYDRSTEIVRYERLTGKGTEKLLLDHYLEALLRKPGALAGSTVLDQARAGGMFTDAHEALWAIARRALGESGGTRALIEVLLLHRHLEHRDVVAGIRAAMSVGSFAADVVAVEARKAAQRTGPSFELAGGPGGSATTADDDAQVTSLTLRRVADLPADTRPLPTVDAYDQLLRHRPDSQESAS